MQKCARAGGKHNDLDDVGRTRRHTVFFEMMGNFSFGDYFKEKAIPWAWEYVTEDLGLDGDRIWITVHTSDDEAEQIWHDAVGVPIGRIQRLGDADNFWQMGDTGPCGPCSELHIDRGPSFGPDGGPLADPAGERFMEFWNLVFMQYDQAPDGTRTPLPRPSIDTGAGLERILTLLQGVDSVWDTDVLRPIIEVASSLTGHAYGKDERTDVSLRILAEHARSGTMLVNDGVFPSNEDRGYVLRRILRRAIRHAFLLGADKLVMPGLVEESIAVMGEAYPDVVKNRDFITGVITREEERFRQTLRTGLTILEDELSSGATVLPGAAAFKLHDTFGFPLEVTTEITAERGVEVDVDGFNVEMAEQRRRAKDALEDRRRGRRPGRPLPGGVRSRPGGRDMMQLSAEARNLNWLVSNFVERVPGVNEATVVSSDGLLIALSDGLDRSSGDRLAAVSAGLLSIAKGGSTPIGGGRVHEVIVEMDLAMLFVMRVSDTSVLAATTARPCDVGLVGYEMAVLVEKCAAPAHARSDLVNPDRAAEVGDPMSGLDRDPREHRVDLTNHSLVRPYMLTAVARTPPSVSSSCTRPCWPSSDPSSSGREQLPKTVGSWSCARPRCRSPSCRHAWVRRSGSCASSWAIWSSPVWCTSARPRTAAEYRDVRLLERLLEGIRAI